MSAMKRVQQVGHTVCVIDGAVVQRKRSQALECDLELLEKGRDQPTPAGAWRNSIARTARSSPRSPSLTICPDTTPRLLLTQAG